MIHGGGKGEFTFEHSVRPFPAIEIFLFHFIVMLSLSGEGQDISFDVNGNLFLFDPGEIGFDYGAVVGVIDIDHRIPGAFETFERIKRVLREKILEKAVDSVLKHRYFSERVPSYKCHLMILLC
jgi:hypothetical protein